MAPPLKTPLGKREASIVIVIFINMYIYMLYVSCILCDVVRCSVMQKSLFRHVTNILFQLCQCLCLGYPVEERNEA